MADLCPFFKFLLLCLYWFPIINVCRDALILLKVCRIYHCKIQVNFDISDHQQNFGRVMALFRQFFFDIGLHSITFAGMH